MRLSGHFNVTDSIGPNLGRCLVYVSFDDPGLATGFLEILKRLAQLLDGLEASDPEEVFLEGPNEALGTTITLGFAHVGRRVFETEEGDLIPEVVTDILAAMVMKELETGGDVLGKGTKALAHPLFDRFQCLELIVVPGSMDAGAFGRAVVDRDETRVHAAA